MLAVLAVVLLGGAGLYPLMNSRTFQLAGRLTDRVDTTEKVVALTFDDGPDEHTQEIISTLAEHRVRATFFVVGSQVEARPQDARALVAAGHQLANHTFTHRRMVFVSPSTVAEEIERTDRAIRGAGQRGDIPFRPPTGKKLLTLPLYLADHRRHTVMWDVEPDSDARPAPAQIVSAVREQTRPGSIILLHPWYAGGANTRASLSALITTLRTQGYRFVTVSELLNKT
ncbi:polysaccharide deacetylase family protein [Bailinhaonella thermotolerans]|uniref:polysaccharide deacetylase family protein n=1 Tax=Bailinhaonella thermotolerans TaxID=1070861 RepID=UPI001F5B3988|nr:polysaccharide deacetylase family protein [Bailinhaonella thermotolerans]